MSEIHLRLDDAFLEGISPEAIAFYNTDEGRKIIDERIDNLVWEALTKVDRDALTDEAKRKIEKRLEE